MARRLTAELVGTALLVTVVVGSGIAAQRLSPGDVGLQLLENSTATVPGLTILILMFGPISGAHFNPVVSAADWVLGRRSGTGLPAGDVVTYASPRSSARSRARSRQPHVPGPARPAVHQAPRGGANLLLGEMVATAGLVLLIFALARTGRGVLAAPAVGAYIGAAYWFTSSTSFANPAVTIGRVFSDTFAGIAPGSVPGFIGAQIVGAAVAVGLVPWLYPHIGDSADDVVIPFEHHPSQATRDHHQEHSMSTSAMRPPTHVTRHRSSSRASGTAAGPSSAASSPSTTPAAASSPCRRAPSPATTSTPRSPRCWRSSASTRPPSTPSC